MPRPCKRRRICAMPTCYRFGPLPPKDQKIGDGQTDAVGPQVVTMTIDEYESIRLIDLEGLSQEGCAQRMGVARTTAQAIYRSARTKLAFCLAQGWELSIEGGDYLLCDGNASDCGCWQDVRPRNRREGNDKMKVAVTYDGNGGVFQHFGMTQEFKVYTIENGAITSSEILGSGGNGHEALVNVLADDSIEALICGGIGGGAVNAITQSGISLYAGVSGSADEAAAKFAAGTLPQTTAANCDHHGAAHNHEGGNCPHHQN